MHDLQMKYCRYLVIPIVLLLSIIIAKDSAKGDECGIAITTKDMFICLDLRLRATQQELNRLQTRVESLLTKEQRAMLAGAHTTWLAYRDANCACSESLFRGGSMEPLVLLGCKVRMTEQRIKEIGLIYEERLRLPAQQ